MSSSPTQHVLCAGVGDGEPALPSEAPPGQRIRLPGQTKVTTEEYKEFLGLGHGDIFDLDPDLCAPVSGTHTGTVQYLHASPSGNTPHHVAYCVTGSQPKSNPWQTCRVVDAPWRMPVEDMKAFFNYDLNLHKWREYCKRVEQYRLQYTMQVYCSRSGRALTPLIVTSHTTSGFLAATLGFIALHLASTALMCDTVKGHEQIQAWLSS